MEFTAKIADLTVGISCKHSLIESMCREYLTEVAPMFYVRASEEHKEKLRNYFLGFSEVFSDDYLESVAISECIADEFLIIMPPFFMPRSSPLTVKA